MYKMHVLHIIHTLHIYNYVCAPIAIDTLYTFYGLCSLGI